MNPLIRPCASGEGPAIIEAVGGSGPVADGKSERDGSLSILLGVDQTIEAAIRTALASIPGVRIMTRAEAEAGGPGPSHRVALVQIHERDRRAIEFAKRAAEGGPVILVARGDPPSERALQDAVSDGATDYIVLDRTELQAQGEEIRMAVRRAFGENPSTETLVGRSGAIENLRAWIRHVGPSEGACLVYGESGTGKELVAQELSRVRGGPLVSLNCGASNLNLLQSELFGHERGSFTGAHERRVGVFEQADGGTLFLDEIGDMLPEAQILLLRVLQEKTFCRVGGKDPITVSVRVVAATHQNLHRRVANGRFREDLYYRLRVHDLTVSPLRARIEDIPLLVRHFVYKHGKVKRIIGCSTEALARLRSYDYPGNVRELEGIILQAVAFCENGIIRAQHLRNLDPGIEHDLERPASGRVQLAGDPGRLPADGAHGPLEAALAETNTWQPSGDQQHDRATLLRIFRDHGLSIRNFKHLCEQLRRRQRDNPDLLVAAHPMARSLFVSQLHTLNRPSAAPAPNSAHLTAQQDMQVTSPGVTRRPADAERRQLTVMLCDLVDSTVLSGQLDPEDCREVVHMFHQACAEVIKRFDGHVAQYLSDGLLVYFGYPQAHEDDARRAITAGLEALRALQPLNTNLVQSKGIRLATRFVIHTGLVVVGDSCGEEELALGEPPSVAAQLKGLAEPDTVTISGDTLRLVEGHFVTHDGGTFLLNGMATPVHVYRVLGESGVQSRFDVCDPARLTPLVGREQEVGLLRERWAQVRDGMGQVVLVSGEGGIGKSRLVHAMKQHLASELHTRWECRGSPYHQHSALFPMIDLFQRVFRFQHGDTPEVQLRKLEDTLAPYLSLPEVVPLIASLFSLPSPDRYPPLTLTPERRKQKIFEAVLAVLLKWAAQQPILFVVEDLHWVDPSSLELLGLLVDHGPTAPILTLLTFRPTFASPWTGRSHLTHITLTRLSVPQVKCMVLGAAGNKALPEQVVQQVVTRSDGVPLFVEELIKTVFESGFIEEQEDHYELTGPLAPLTLPATLQDSLMARLDRLDTARRVAQLGACFGRKFSYDLLQAIMPLDDLTLQRELSALVDAEILYRQGVPPRATYIFKHALVQEVAYQSLLKSVRRLYHRQIAEVLEERFPETVEDQPELLAHHYTEAAHDERAVDYWRRAGQRAIERSAYLEAIAYLRRGLDVLRSIADVHKRAEYELSLQVSLGVPLIVTKGYAAPEVETLYARARELCSQGGETPHLANVLWGLCLYYTVAGKFRTALELADQYRALVETLQDPASVLETCQLMGLPLFHLGELIRAQAYFEQGSALYNPRQHHALVLAHGGADTGLVIQTYGAVTLWLLGYPDQAREKMRESLSLAETMSHPFSLAYARFLSAWFYKLCREERAAYEAATAAIALASEHGFPYWGALGTIVTGGTLVADGAVDDGIAQMCQGLAFLAATGAQISRANWLGLLAEAYGKARRPEDGLRVLTEALTVLNQLDERVLEAELYRLKGELVLYLPGEHQAQAESCFREAIEIAHRQSAKSLELRATICLGRLLEKQGRREEARHMLAEIYSWFTEGFETRDLQDANALLQELT